jgi:hypothetical protein
VTLTMMVMAVLLDSSSRCIFHVSPEVFYSEGAMMKYRSALLAFKPSGFEFSTELLQFQKDYCRGFVCVTSVVMLACV